ncbi:hypothetical protein Q8F55_000593 [Vanrija albida]|uniref:NAD(P)-binding domain-containing protein n=1 Tax=Vanrija albida TaxID=181172 RepID=A0ABR3QDP9_9TREE
MHLAILGASRGVNYHTLLAALSDPAITRVSLLLRRADALDADGVVGPAVKSGRVRVVAGDATREEDVAALLEETPDVVVTSIGGVPRLTLRGIVLDQPSVCTRAAVALLRALARLGATPRLVAISSMGIGDNHGAMPLALRDKEGLEYLVRRAARGLPTPDAVPPVVAEPAAVREDFLPEVVVVRPALLTDGSGGHAVKAAADAYTYYVSRADVGRFVATRCLQGEEWANKAPVVGY